MKVRYRALSLILSVMMVLTFMPAMAFAEDSNPSGKEVMAEGSWDADSYETEYWLPEFDPLTLSVFVDYYGDYEIEENRPALEFNWYDQDNSYLGGEDQIEVTSAGDYYCEVIERGADGEVVSSDTVSFTVHPFDEGGDDSYWWIYIEGSSKYDLDSEGGQATLSVELDYNGEMPDVTYSWTDENGDVVGGNSREITVTERGTYTCYVTDGKLNRSVTFRVVEGKHWWSVHNGQTVWINPGETGATLKVEIEFEDEYTSDLTYQWYKEYWDEEEGTDKRELIEGEDGDSIDVEETGDYYCIITDELGNSEESFFDVKERDTEGGWYVFPKDDEEDVRLSEDGEATLTVVTEYTGDEKPTLEYTWYKYNDEDDEGVEVGSGEALDVNETGNYWCSVSDGDNVKRVEFYVHEYEEEYSDLDWNVEIEDYDYFLNNGRVTITAEPYYWGEGTPTYTYQWQTGKYNEAEDYYEWTDIPGATSASYVATKGGMYMCEVKIDVNGEKDIRSAECEVFSWRILNSDTYVRVKYNTPATLEVKTDYKGSDISYQWQSYEYDEGEEDGTYVDIPGATKAKFTTENITAENEGSEYRCKVTVAGQTQYEWYEVYLDTSDYTWDWVYPDAVAKYQTHDGRELTVDYFYDEEEYRDVKNFPEDGDKIIMTSGSHTDEYIYNDEDGFVNSEGEYLYFETDIERADASSGTISAYVNSDRVRDHENKKITYKYSTELSLPVTFTTEVKSIKFEPTTISVYSEDIKETYDGHTYYELYRRNKEGGAFIEGDKLTVVFTDGTTKVFTGNKEGDLVYKNKGNTEYANPEFGDYSLRAGNNAVKLYFQGKVTTVNVFMDTPQMRADRAADAEWNGVLSSKIPAAKSVKAKAGKKRATVSWKKANKKNLKKFDKIEIQISNNKQFDRKNPLTKRFLVKKSKKNYTIKKLTKGTYYVRVRHVKGTGATKQVSKWSKPKRVKIKK